MNGDIEIAAIRLNRDEFDKADMKQSSAQEVLLKSNLYSSKTSNKKQLVWSTNHVKTHILYKKTMLFDKKYPAY